MVRQRKNYKPFLLKTKKNKLQNVFKSYRLQNLQCKKVYRLRIENDLRTNIKWHNNFLYFLKKVMSSKN